MVKLMFFR